MIQVRNTNSTEKKYQFLPKQLFILNQTLICKNPFVFPVSLNIDAQKKNSSCSHCQQVSVYQRFVCSCGAGSQAIRYVTQPKASIPTPNAPGRTSQILLFFPVFFCPTKISASSFSAETSQDQIQNPSHTYSSVFIFSVNLIINSIPKYPDSENTKSPSPLVNLKDTAIFLFLISCC